MKKKYQSPIIDVITANMNAPLAGSPEGSFDPEGKPGDNAKESSTIFEDFSEQPSTADQ